MVWSLSERYLIHRSRFRQYQKQHKAELQKCFACLERLLEGLNENKVKGNMSNPPGYVHPEGKGVHAIAVKSKGKKALRLYFFPVEHTETIELLLVGDKDTQKKDVLESHKKAEAIKKEKAHHE
ncbi:MAG: hypothetical protein ACLFQ6_10145 [Candidatus Sumerlaeia bacterium]